jgi:hypothetical protein
MWLFLLGVFASLFGVVVLLLKLFFSSAPPRKKLKIPTTDFIPPTIEFANLLVSSHARIPDVDAIESLCDNLLRMQGVPPHLYTIDKDKEKEKEKEKEPTVPRLGAWTGCLQSVGIINPALPPLIEQRWTVSDFEI